MLRSVRALPLLALLTSLASTSCRPPASAAAAPYPLDPLTGPEIGAAAQIVRAARNLPEIVVFPEISLREPPKAEVLAASAGHPIPREAFLIALDRETSRTYEAVADLSGRRVVSWREIPGVQPSLLIGDYQRVPEIVRSDARWQAAIRRRGIRDAWNVMIELWAPGYTDAAIRRHRLVRALSYYRGGTTNGYARPIEGVVALVDADQERVVQVVESGPLALPPDSADYVEHSVRPVRPAPRPLRIVQPLGPEFELRGSEVRWQRWRFRFGMRPREGLVLYQVAYDDAGRVRPLLFRASLSEMVVPYADPDPNWSWRSAFDVGEYGIGRAANTLVRGLDVPENATLVDATFADDLGRPYVQRGAVALYERDGGLLWRHYDEDIGRTETRRGRELVIAFTTTSGNYDYSLAWVFRQDGSLSQETILTGIMEPKGVALATSAGRGGGMDDAHGHRVAPGVVAVSHQHFFNFRLDLDVDGPTPNTVVQMDTRSLPVGPSNPVGNAFEMTEEPLRSELQARRDLNLSAARKWVVINPAVHNRLGQATGYALIPGENAVPYAAPGSRVRQRAGFVEHHLWVTPYDPAEIYAAGDYPNQSEGGDGLPKWTHADRPIAGTDVVLWYTAGVTHVPRPEEWPVMPAHRTGFTLLPIGFFPRNPALDLPRRPYTTRR